MTSFFTRRAFLLSATVGLTLGAGAAHAAPTLPRRGRRGPRVLVATNEPWGYYHVGPIVDEVLALGGSVTQVVPDLSKLPDPAKVERADAIRAITPADLPAVQADVLLVNGATEWPARVARAVSALPIVASSLAYLKPELAPFAHEIRPRLAAITAMANADRETFAAHLGVSECEIRVVGTPELDTLPERVVEPGTVLALTSVTYPDSTGGAAPGTQLLLDSARALKAAGKHVIVGLHPREDASLWSEFEIATEGSLAASARAEVAFGIPGSVFPKIAAVGTPLVGVVDEGLNVPQYLLDICTPASTVEDVVAAVQTAAPLAKNELRDVVGPLGKAGKHLARVLFSAARGQ